MCESNRSLIKQEISHVSVTTGVPVTHTIVGMSDAFNSRLFQQEIHSLLLRRIRLVVLWMLWRPLVLFGLRWSLLAILVGVGSCVNFVSKE